MSKKKTIPLTCNQIFWIFIGVLIPFAIYGNYFIYDLDYKATQGGIWFPIALLLPVIIAVSLGFKTLGYLTNNYKCKCDKK